MLKYHRIRGDMIALYKILTNKCSKNITLHFKAHRDQRTRGYSMKLATFRCH